ncbi:nucleotide exchange factor GrpE [Parasporobacterium paucivorans]|nr:nucleotide exchange factor GrpE [Parasporobacterium paucivorans]
MNTENKNLEEADTDQEITIQEDTVKTEEVPAGEENTEEDSCHDESSTKKSKKIKKDKHEQQVEELTDKLKRNMAEFENFRKRTEKEKAAMYDVGAKKVIEKLLPVIDGFERGLLTLSEEEVKEPFAQGMDMVYKQLMQSITDLGVMPIEALNKEFNPDFHNAVMHVEDESVGANVVVEEFQKGYTYRDSVVRYSMVKVAN